jgi:uncharacterized protein YkwD
MVKYNAEKIIFKCWKCGLRYGQMKAFPHHYFRLRRRVKITVEPYISKGSSIHKEKRRPKLKKTLFGVLAIAIIFGAFFFLYENPNILNLQNLLPQTPTHDELVEYALSLINSDRQQNGFQNVTLSSIDSGQLHAEDMLKNGYFSHWDMNDYKPYMRYTLAGGQGAVAENCATQLGSYSDLKTALKQMEYSMMYDDAASDWGHKDNILNPLHNEVSIGIAYDNNNVYFVEDFENDYVSWSIRNVDNNQVTMQGTIQEQGLTIKSIDVFYDNPSPLTVSQLENPPYQGGYDTGTYVATVVPPAPSGQYYDWSGISVTGIVADNWNQNGNTFQISFSLSQAVAVYGNGVYTLYMDTGTSTADSLTTYSVWIN